MSTSASTLASVTETGVIGVIRLTQKLPRDAATALVGGGVTVLEVTLTTPFALESIAELTAELPQCVVGAGTVLDADAARGAIAAGARFVVSPVFDAGVVAVCRDNDVLCMPGAVTPTELLEAWRAGASLIKVFPSSQMGPAYFHDVLAPMPFLRLVPSGGVSLANAGDWIRAGAAAVSVGTSLINAGSVRDGNGAALSNDARALVTAVAAARQQL